MQMVTLNKDDIYQGPLVLVNHNYPIANNYQITNCSTAKDSTISLEKTAMEMLTKALQEIKAEDKIVLVSGLRSGQEQAMIYNQAIQNHGKEFVDKFVARVNCSEHQTGLAIDLAVKNETIDIFCPDFTSQEVCQQFRDIASDYGFIQRYSKNKIDFTKISEEPWHFRYVGIVHAKIMEENQWCFEEYHLYIKNHSIFNPYVLDCQGKLVEVFYVPAVNEQTKLNLSDHGSYQISGNNCDGFIITSWRPYV